MHKKYLQVLLMCCCCAFIIACSKMTIANYNRVKTGMSLPEVTAILGEPSNTESVDLGGLSGTTAIWKDKNAEITIQFLNGKVTIKTFRKAGERNTSDIHIIT